MEKPYIICHMVTSLDGKVTGDFLRQPECQNAENLYYQIHREYRADGFACGRVTMEESFTHGYYPDLEQYAPPAGYRWKMDHIPENTGSFFAVAFDPHGRLGWQNDRIRDEDPGYDKAQIIEIVTEQVDGRYLGYLESKGIAYLFAGREDLDLPLALMKLRRFFGIQMLLLEGGSILNGAFQRCGLIDELSLVTAPLIADSNAKPLFNDPQTECFVLKQLRKENGALWMNYKRSLQ